uniref:RNase H type-1 domain-containing protein n=1 Tax=Fagus sylvatica TaxID=28930 RepID=A0A2N9H0N4_FAGSY
MEFYVPIKKKVYKAKFFPDGTILDASARRRGSYAWQSILKARDIITKGACWRVGDGAKIKIWNSRWLPEPHHWKILSPLPDSLQTSIVSKLILPSPQRWNIELIDRMFLPYDATAIQCIPLSERRPNDNLIWPGSKTGRYTIAWTPEARLNSVKPTPVQDFADLALKILNVGDNQQRAKFGIICWALCHHRNKARLNKLMEHIKQINTFAQSYLEEFTHCNSGHDPIPLPRTQIKWKAPTTCHYKINYDGAVFRDKDEAGLGVVVRDAQGLPMASLAYKIKLP